MYYRQRKIITGALMAGLSGGCAGRENHCRPGACFNTMTAHAARQACPPGRRAGHDRVASMPHIEHVFPPNPLRTPTEHSFPGNGARSRLVSFQVSASPVESPTVPPSISDPTTMPGHARRAPLPNFSDTVIRDLKDFPGVFWEDTRKVYTDVPNLVILGFSYGVSLTLQATDVDDTVENSFKTHRTFKDDWRDAFGALGNPGLHFGVAGLFYLIGQQEQDEQTYQVGTKLFRALALTGVTVMVGKAATWDDVPNGEFGSFPSGHTASTFALASVLHDEYGPWVGVPLYGLGVLVAYTRLEDEEHYFSDVVMGGVLGLVVGHTLARDGEPLEVAGGRIVPYADPVGESTGILWVHGIR